MNLWIRSQKNNDNIRPILLKVESLELGDDYDDMNCIVANNLYNIGTYKNKERALEVLDKIQELLEPVHITNISKKEGIVGANIFYEMPKE